MFSLHRKGWFGQHLEENIRSLEDGDYQKIPLIFCVFAEKHDVSKKMAAEALSNILKNIEVDEIIQIGPNENKSNYIKLAPILACMVL